MATHVITVIYGGKWLFDESGPTFAGHTTSKVFILDDSITLQGLSEKVHNRFNVDSAFELEFNHLHPFKVLRGPLTVECDADLKEFLELSKLDDVKFAVELCVSIKTDNDKEDQQTFPADSLELVTCNPNITNIVTEENSMTLIGDNRMKGVLLEDIGDDMYSGNSDTPSDEDSAAEIWSTLYSSAHRRETTLEDWDADSPTMPIMNQNSEKLIYIGKTFESRNAVKNALRILSITEIFGFRVAKSEPRYYRVHCVDPNCKWKVHVKTFGQTWHEVTVYDDMHTCTWDIRSKHCKKPSSSVVASIIKSR